jgi:hypothetical protein
VDELVLRERMQAAADLAANHARPPGAGAARRRGRRRQAQIVGWVALSLLAAVAVPLTPTARTLWEQTTPPPVAVAPPSTTSNPAAGPLGQPATGPVRTVIGGTSRGRSWSYIAYRSGDRICHGFRRAPQLLGGGSSCQRFTKQTGPISFAASAGRRIDGTSPARFAHGAVTKAALLIEVALAGRNPVHTHAFGPADMPVSFFVVELPRTATATQVTAYDKTGRVVARQRLSGLASARPEPAQIGAGDTGWLAEVLSGAGYRPSIGEHHVVTATAGGRRILVWTTTDASRRLDIAMYQEGYGIIPRSDATTVYGNGGRAGWLAQGRLVWVDPEPQPQDLDRLVDQSQRVSRTGAG